MVGDGLTRSSVRATSPISISWKNVAVRRQKRAHPKQGRDCLQASWRKKPQARTVGPRLLF
jgi:hypothetical protein